MGGHWKITGIHKYLYSTPEIHIMYLNICAYFEQDAAAAKESNI